MAQKEYSNGEVTVIWKPDLCIHSGNCFKGLPDVFKPQERPWVQLEGISTEDIRAQVDKCPSGALSYKMVSEKESSSGDDIQKIELVENGPLIIHGKVELSGKDGSRVLQTPKTALCRCGASSNKPLCDGTHKKIEFKS